MQGLPLRWNIEAEKEPSLSLIIDGRTDNARARAPPPRSRVWLSSAARATEDAGTTVGCHRTAPCRKAQGSQPNEKAAILMRTPAER